MLFFNNHFVLVREALCDHGCLCVSFSRIGEDELLNVLLCELVRLGVVC